jgi:hypothetical protein
MHCLRAVVCSGMLLLGPAVGDAQTTRVGTVPVRTSVPPVLPGTTERAFSTIQGNALTSNEVALPDSMVRLRDARFGRIVGTRITDKAGLFVFEKLDPGTYVVELLAGDRTVAAASELLAAGPGDVLSAVVKLPFRPEPFGGLLGHTMQQALAVMSAAAASGVLVTNVAGVDASAR